MGYRLAMSTWDNQTVTLARFVSRCTPELSSVAPDLLFLLSCDAINGATEYRVLRADGKLLCAESQALAKWGSKPWATIRIALSR